METRTYKGHHQYRDDDGKWRYAYRRVAEKKVGGEIGDGRIAHYIDGDKNNNNPENLWIMTNAKRSKRNFFEKLFQRRN